MLRKTQTNHILNLLILNLATFMRLGNSILSSDSRIAVMEFSAMYNFYYKILLKLWTIMVKIISNYDQNYATIIINYG